MKRVLLLFIIISAISCTKEKDSNSLVGQWTIVQTDAGTGGGTITTSYQPGAEFSISLTSNQDLVISGPNSNHSPLSEFNKYEFLSNNRIRFYNNLSNAQSSAVFSLNENLVFQYEGARCGYEEKFIRH